jgi:hypothetical protein
MAYTCPQHDCLLVCSKCYVQALAPERVEVAVEQARPYLGRHWDYPVFEMPCPVCEQSLICFRCNMEVIAEAGHYQED